MAFRDVAEALTEGFADAAGATSTAGRIRKKQDDRQATAREELEAKSHEIFQDVKRLQDRRAALDPKSPTYATDLAGIDASLTQHQQAFTDLYHPEKNPGALQHLSGFIKSHLGKQQPNIPSTPGEAKQTMAQLQASAAGTGQSPATPQNPILAKRQQMKDAGYSDDDIARAEHRTPPVQSAAPVATPAPDSKPVHKTADERKRDDFAEWKKSHPAFKGTFEEWAYQITHPGKPPKPAGAPKLTPAQNHAQIGYIDASKLSKVADEVEKNPNDAVNQKRLAVALERISAGRFTKEALDYIVKAGWGNTLEQWANNPSTGALPKDVMRQLVDGAHQNLDAAKGVLKEADDLAPKVPTTPGEAKKRVQSQGGADDVDAIIKALKNQKQ